MKNQVRAGIFVALFLICCTATVTATMLILQYLEPTIEQLGIAFSLVLLSYTVKCLYDLRMSQLDARDRLNEITKTNPTLK